MALKHLEHDGNEDFLEKDFPNRKNSRIIELDEADSAEEKEQARIEQEQHKYMRIDNPILWDGEI